MSGIALEAAAAANAIMGSDPSTNVPAAVAQRYPLRGQHGLQPVLGRALGATMTGPGWAGWTHDPELVFTASVAAFTAVLAIFTAALVVVGIVQARRLRDAVKATEKSIEFAEHSLLLIERPLIVVETTYSFGIDAYKQMNFTVKNHGRTAGELIDYCAELAVAEALPSRPVYGEPVLFDKVIAPGQTTHGIVVNVPALVMDAMDEIKNQTKKLFLFGYLRYRGTFTPTIVKGFGFQIAFNALDVKWIAGGEEYNYTRNQNG
jgi:hypothetical protein